MYAGRPNRGTPGDVLPVLFNFSSRENAAISPFARVRGSAEVSQTTFDFSGPFSQSGNPRPVSCAEAWATKANIDVARRPDMSSGNGGCTAKRVAPTVILILFARRLKTSRCRRSTYRHPKQCPTAGQMLHSSRAEWTEWSGAKKDRRCLGVGDRLKSYLNRTFPSSLCIASLLLPSLCTD